MYARRKNGFKRVISLGFVIVLCFTLSVVFFSQPLKTAALSGSDWQAGRIIDDAVFNYASSMSIEQVQRFLNAKVPTCDNWGIQVYNDTTRRAYSESKGVSFPLTCLKDYYENTTTKENNLEGRSVPVGAKSAATIIWEASQQYSVNPQVLLVLLQKEQSLVFDDWPWPKQFRSATGYGCPDTAACDAEYYGFYNQVSSAARQFRKYATNPANYNYSTGNNYIQYNPDASCGGGQVYIQDQATASLYNYTPYQPNQAALSNLYGTGDSCSAYGNRNFWRMFNDWFGSPLIFDPYGWEVIKTATDSREFLAIGNTKRWIPSGDLKNDWNLGTKPVNVVSQEYMDSIATLPTLGRLGWYNNRNYYVDGGKRYWLSDEDVLRAWGQYKDRNLAVPAYIPLSTLQDGGEATFYITSGGEVARLVDGNRYTIATSYADRWRANPITMSAVGYSEFNNAATVDYRISVNGIEYLVDNGKLINISNAAMKRDYGQNNATFINVPSQVLKYLPQQQAKRLVRSSNQPHWFMLFGGQQYYVSSGSLAKSWGIAGDPLVISQKLSESLAVSSTIMTALVKEQESGKVYLLDGSRHEATGVMLDSAQSTAKTITAFASEYLAGLPVGNSISTPVVIADGHVFSMLNGELYHIPNSQILNCIGYPRKYNIAPVDHSLIGSLFSGKGMNTFIVSGGTTYFLQDGYAFPISSAAKADWVGDQTPVVYSSPNFSTRFNVANTSSELGNHIIENSQRMIISNGYVVSIGNSDAYAADGEQQISVFGMPRTGTLTYLVKADSGDGSIWLVSNGTRQYILSGEELNTYSKNGSVPVTTMSATALSTIPQVNNGQKLSPLLITDGKGYKLLYEDGSFFGFVDSDTVNNFISGNKAQNLSSSIYGSFTQYRRNITRLIKDPSGKVYWLENGRKRWITNGVAYQRYAGTTLVDVSYYIANWLPDGAPII